MSVKVGATDGSVDVSQVIAAIDWVVQHRHDNGLNIRVLNLSYGTDSTQPYTVDPLAFAVEQAWKAGIFVVAATGNEGYVFKTGTLTNPAFDPKIFAVGASDSMGTARTSDDTVAPFSSTGSNARYVDVVAPGSHIVSLRVPGSYIDQAYGSTGYVSDTLFRGSGTSEAAAFTSGEAALAIQQRPAITPDKLKKLFLSNARSLNGYSSIQQGQGVVDMSAMLGARTCNAPKQWNTIAWSTGTGSLELSRGTEHLTDGVVPLVGEMDIFGQRVRLRGRWRLRSLRRRPGRGASGTAARGAAAPGRATPGAAHTWSGNTWSGNTWSGNTWCGNTWSGQYLVGQHVVRQHLERAAPGPATHGRRTRGAATGGRAAPGWARPGVESRATALAEGSADGIRRLDERATSLRLRLGGRARLVLHRGDRAGVGRACGRYNLSPRSARWARRARARCRGPCSRSSSTSRRPTSCTCSSASRRTRSRPRRSA